MQIPIFYNNYLLNLSDIENRKEVISMIARITSSYKRQMYWFNALLFNKSAVRKHLADIKLKLDNELIEK
jgi:hypothetical protein